jgi:hypothetical protein
MLVGVTTAMFVTTSTDEQFSLTTALLQVKALLPKDLSPLALSATANDASELLRLVPPTLVADENGVRVWHKLVSAPT